MTQLISVTTLTGKQYRLNVYPIGTSFKEVPGIYMFLKPAANGKWDPVYTGEAEDFNDRLFINLERHHQWTCISRNGASHLALMQVNGGKNVRLNVEQDFRDTFNNAPCNLQ